MRRGDVLGVSGVGVFAIACCGLLPAVIAFAGSLSLVDLLGGGLAFALAVGAAAALFVRAQGRRD